MRCIWCSRELPKVSFERKAHTIPQSLGGIYICSEVCDECNSFFGNYYRKDPPIETVVKECFIISKYRLQNTGIQNKRLKSTFFQIRQNKLEAKSKYKLQRNFQERLTLLLKRGIYKIYLEELHRQQMRAHEHQHNFIREFARYGFGDLPVYYFKRAYPIIPVWNGLFETPEIYFKPELRSTYLFENEYFFEFDFMGHVLGIATNKNWKYNEVDYIKESLNLKQDLFEELIKIKWFQDIDFTLNLMN